MTKRAVVVGATGQIGRAAVRSLAADLVLDMGRAERVLGYRAPVGYPEAVRESVEWLVATVGGAPEWRDALPTAERWLGEHAFDYAAEDRWLAAR